MNMKKVCRGNKEDTTNYHYNMEAKRQNKILFEKYDFNFEEILKDPVFLRILTGWKDSTQMLV